MKVEINVPEIVNIFKDIKGQSEQIFEMMRSDIRETIRQYLSGWMDGELRHFLGRKRYERRKGEVNHRNGSYGRNFTLKGIGVKLISRFQETVRVNLNTHVIPRGKQYEDDLCQDLCLVFLTGISTRSLAMISKKLVGRKISDDEVSNVNKELIGPQKSGESVTYRKSRLSICF